MKRINQFKSEKETLAATLNYFIRVAEEETQKTEMHIPANCNDYVAKELRKELTRNLNKNKEIDLAKKVVDTYNLHAGMSKAERKELKAQIMKHVQFVTYTYQPAERVKAGAKAKESGAAYVYRKIYWADAIESIVNGDWSDTFDTPTTIEPTRCNNGVIYGNYDKD